VVTVNADRNVFGFGCGLLEIIERASKEFIPLYKDDKVAALPLPAAACGSSLGAAAVLHVVEPVPLQHPGTLGSGLWLISLHACVGSALQWTARLLLWLRGS
jgi:hypothetical protein